MTVSTTKRLLSFEEYLTDNDGTDNHYELVDGKLIAINLPTIQHFIIAKLIKIVDPLEGKVSVLLLEEGLYEEKFLVGNQVIVPELCLS